MRFHVLGPLEVVGDAGPVRVNGRRRRALLTVLLFHAGRVVGLAELVDSIWLDDPPESAVANIRTYVSDIRRLLRLAGDSAARLVSHPAGYYLEVGADELDLLRFHELAAEGAAAMKRGDHARAARQLGLALSLWRGRPLEDLHAVGAAVSARAIALEEMRWTVTSRWIDARLALGHHDELIPLLRQMVAERPLYEQTRLRLITALWAAGRTADALSAYRQARRTSVEELGVEPCAELQRAHAAILKGQPPAGLARRHGPHRAATMGGDA
jgi:DNA-binding SARP family transcriptional activator